MTGIWMMVLELMQKGSNSPPSSKFRTTAASASAASPPIIPDIIIISARIVCRFTFNQTIHLSEINICVGSVSVLLYTSAKIFVFLFPFCIWSVFVLEFVLMYVLYLCMFCICVCFVLVYVLYLYWCICAYDGRGWNSHQTKADLVPLTAFTLTISWWEDKYDR